MDEELHSLSLEDILAGQNKLWFAEDGKVYYGRYRDNLIPVEDLVVSSLLPNFYLDDIINAFMLGRLVSTRKCVKLIEEGAEKLSIKVKEAHVKSIPGVDLSMKISKLRKV